jgi:hypothetical protein
MILPGKHLKQNKALLGIGAEIISNLDEPRTVSELWEQIRIGRENSSSNLSFDWFILALTFLYTIGAIDFSRRIISLKGDL